MRLCAAELRNTTGHIAKMREDIGLGASVDAASSISLVIARSEATKQSRFLTALESKIASSLRSSQ